MTISYGSDNSSSYTAESFSISYKSSASSINFSKSDFTDHYVTSSGSKSGVPDIDYIVFTSLPSSKYGILYTADTEKSNYKVNEDDDEIALKDINDLLFVFGDDFTDGKAAFKYYIVDEDGNKSNTATITITNTKSVPVAYDYAVGIEKDETYTFDKEDFTDAYYSADGNSLSSITITSLPEDGTLYLSKTKVVVGDSIKASSLGNLKYEANGKNYRDTFTWQAYDGTNYSAYDANMQIIVFSSSVETAAGDLTVYLDDDQYSFSSSDFVRVFVTEDNDKDALTKIEITSLPSDGTLYLGAEKSSNAVKKGDEITLSELSKLLYVADKSFDSEDDFEYLVYDGSDWCDKDHKGTVTLKTGTGGYTYVKSGSTMTLTFDSQTPTSNTVTGTLTESDVKTLVAAASAGTTLVVCIPASSDVLTRSLVIDDSLFTDSDNLKAITKIKLIDGEVNGRDPVTIVIDTAAVAAQYSRSTSDFTVSMTAVSASSYLSSQYTVGKMRTVDMKIGSTSITKFDKVGSAIITFPCATTTSQTDMAVVLNAASSSATIAAPVVSSKFYYSAGELTADISLLGSGTYLAGVNVQSFTDMNASNWEYSYVINLAARGVIDGYPNGTYLNETEVKRSEYIKLLVESFGLYNVGDSCQFTDLSTGSWYYTYVASAVKNGVLADGGAFNGEAYITRDDMALYSYRAALAAGINLSTAGYATSFTDQSQIGIDYTAAIQAMQRAGILNGYTDGSFKPKGTTDRGEAAKVIRMLLDQYYSN